MARRRSKGTRENSRSEAARRGWETRRANARSASARRGWETRRANEAKEEARRERRRERDRERRQREREARVPPPRIPIQPPPGVYFDNELGVWVYQDKASLMREAEKAEGRPKWTGFPGDLAAYLEDIAGKAYFVIVKEQREPEGPMLFRPYFIPEAWRERAAWTSSAEETREREAPEFGELLEYF